MRKLTFMLLILAALLFPAGAWAAEEDINNEIGFYVQARLPDNQIDKSLSYFNIRMQPGAQRTLLVDVTNEADKAITVRVEVISASTNRNGVIDYKTPDIRDRTLQVPFSHIAEPLSEMVTVEPGKVVQVPVKLTMPDDIFDGVVLGSLVFTKEGDHSDENSEGAVIRNVYSYVIGVVISETDTLVMPDFELVSIVAEPVNYQPAMVHRIRNFAAAIAKNINISLVIRDDSGNTVEEVTRQGVEMAPNSIMPLAVVVDKLKPGDYISEILLTHEGREWLFRQAFTIGAAEAREVNSQLPEAAADNTASLQIIILECIIALLVLWIIILLWWRKKKQEEDDEIQTMDHSPRHR